MQKRTYIEKEVVATGNGDLEVWVIRAVDDDSILAKVYNEHLANVIQTAIEDDIRLHEKAAIALRYANHASL